MRFARFTTRNNFYRWRMHMQAVNPKWFFWAGMQPTYQAHNWSTPWPDEDFGIF